MGDKQRDNWKLAAQVLWVGSALVFPPATLAGRLGYFGARFLINTMMGGDHKQKKLEASYDWQYKANKTASDGEAMPVIYGKVRVKPTIKNQFVTVENGKQYLNILYSFGCHKIDERTVSRWVATGSRGNYRYYTGDEVRPLAAAEEQGKTYVCTHSHTTLTGVTYTHRGYWREGVGTAAITDITVNGNSIDNYPDIDYTTRPGLPQQKLIEGFDVTYTNYPQNETCYFQPYPAVGNWNQVTTTAALTQNIELTFYFPSGLVSDNAGVLSLSTAFLYAQYRKVGTTTWTDFDMGVQLKTSRDPKASKVFDWVNEGITLGAYTLTQGQIQAKTIEPFYISFKAKGPGEYLDPGTYEVRVGCSKTDVLIMNVATIVYGDFIYPGEPLLGLRALASGEINNDIDLRAVCERSTVDVYDTVVGTWTEKSASIHAWAVYDMLCAGSVGHPDATINYGGGVPYTRLDYASFLEWATYSSLTLGYTLNIVFDTFQELWDAVLAVSAEGMGVVYPVGSTFYAMKDQVTPSVDLACMGTVNLGSYKSQWMNASKKANLLEITYFDSEREYEPTTFSIRTADWDDGVTLSEPAKLVLPGTDNFNQAYKLGKYKLNCNEYLNQVVQLELDVDSLQLTVGKVVRLQHDVPDIGYGGLIVSSVLATKTITFDQTIPFAAGPTPWVVYIRYNNDTIYPFTLVNPGTPSTSAVSLTDFPGAGAPPAQAPYIIGLSNTSYKEYRIIDIKRSQDHMPTVTMLEYNATVYGNPNIPDLDLPTKTTFNSATNLKAVEVLSRRYNGEYQSNIRVTWDATLAAFFNEWEVLYRNVDARDQNWIGDWEAGTYNKYEKVVHGGFAYVSLMDVNTLEPGLTTIIS